MRLNALMIVLECWGDWAVKGVVGIFCILNWVVSYRTVTQ